MNRRRFLLVAAAAALAPFPAAAAVRWRGVALGADASLVLYGEASAAEAALAAARGVLAEAERLFSLHDPASALSALNRTGHIAAPPRFAELLAIADRIYRATGGRFDPTVQPLWRALATGGDTGAAEAAIGWGRVTLGPVVRLAPGQALTLNGIAQGFATDLVAETLRAAGFTRALVEVGEHRALGGPFRLGIEDPAAGLLATRTLTDGAIATSSPGALAVGGRAHILDPRGGLPLWSTVSVEADTAAVADGLSTAMCLMGADEIAALKAANADVRRVTLVDRTGDLSTV